MVSGAGGVRLAAAMALTANGDGVCVSVTVTRGVPCGVAWRDAPGDCEQNDATFWIH